MKTRKHWMAVTLAVLGMNMAGPVLAQGIPVIDNANLTQTVISAVEAVEQTANQIQQLQTQLQQYQTQIAQLQNMQLNTEQLAATSQIFTAASAAMLRLQNLSNTLGRQQVDLGGLDALLGQFIDQTGYQSSCVGTGCSRSQLDALSQADREKTAAAMAANSAVLRGNDEQSRGMQNDAAALERLQGAVQSAQGQLAAAQANGQLAAAQADQLLKIRALLMSQANAQALRDQRQIDLEARQREADAALLSGSFRKGSTMTWGPGALR